MDNVIGNFIIHLGNNDSSVGDCGNSVGGDTKDMKSHVLFNSSTVHIQRPMFPGYSSSIKLPVPSYPIVVTSLAGSYYMPCLTPC
jgi:hypothetical protein